MTPAVPTGVHARAPGEPGARAGRPRRWFSPQPNVPGRGIVASYTLRFWSIVVAIGVIAGLGAIALMKLLHFVEHVAYGYRSGSFLHGAAAAASWRHVLALGIAALLVALGAFLLQRLPPSGAAEVSDALWVHGARMPLIESFARAVLSIVTVGLGSSLGREGAPQVVGAASASRLADWAQIPIWQRRLLVASGAGAGFAAVYNVPLGGSLFALEVLLGTVSLPLVLPALATAVIATAVGWIGLGTHPTYELPAYHLAASQMIWALLAGPLIGAVAIGWVRLVRRAARMRPRRWGRYVAPFVVLLILGAVSIAYPQLLGNGKGVVQLEAVGRVSLGLAVVLLVLKPLATAACLGSGSPGGLFTPSLTVGVLLAGILGTLWSHIWPGAPLGSYAVIGGGAFLAAVMQGPLSGVVLVLELTRNFDALMAPTLLAVIEATVFARRLGAPSIYSARVHAPDEDASVEALGDPPSDALPDDAAAVFGTRTPGAGERAAGTTEPAAGTTERAAGAERAPGAGWAAGAGAPGGGRAGAERSGDGQRPAGPKRTGAQRPVAPAAAEGLVDPEG
ncbi:MAG TPA: chloride channel protein [Solirubrobacteraceae bacterium]|nr:chloride channel protein [Solirubrobacteraceae bacterium]